MVEFICFLYFFPEEEVKKQWKSLRDNFRVELTKQRSQTKSGSDSSALLKPKWIYMDQLLFLRDIMDPAPMTGGLSPLPGLSHDGQVGCHPILLMRKTTVIK